MQPKLSFILISDTHLGPTRDHDYYGQRPAACLERVVTLINDFPVQPDFVLHMGDLANDASASSYAIATEILARLHVPIYYVNGNHDSRPLLRERLGAPPHPSGDPDAPLDYTFEIKGERFLVLDAHDIAVPQPQGHLNDDQLAWVSDEAVPDGPPLTVLLHYPPFRMGLPWLDDNMLIDNGHALHEALLPARDRLRGVFFGHMHRSSQIIRDGITYSCVASTVFQYAWRPWDPKPQVDADYPPGYAVVQYLAKHAVVLHYTFPWPET